MDNMTVAELEEYVRYVSGSTPALLAAEFPGKIATLPVEECAAFLGAILIAAMTQKRVLSDWLAAPEQAAVARYIRTEYYLQDHINFSALNMLGHCVLASDYNVSLSAVTAFRARLGGNSIWHMNTRDASISGEMLRIFEERVQRFPRAAATQAGNMIMFSIYTRAGMPNNPDA